MELKDLLNLQSPTLEQYAEMDKQLLAIARQAYGEIERIDAEERARSADRLVGKDDGGEARAIARAEAEKRQTDAEHVLADVRSKAANLECRLAKAADDRAWAEVHKLINHRTQSMKEIEALCARIGELYHGVVLAGNEARKKAPAKPDPENIINLPGLLPAQIGAAVMASVHIAVDHPFSRLAIESSQFSDTYCRFVGREGLPSFLGPVHNAILLSDQ